MTPSYIKYFFNRIPFTSDNKGNTIFLRYEGIYNDFQKNLTDTNHKRAFILSGLTLAVSTTYVILDFFSQIKAVDDNAQEVYRAIDLFFFLFSLVIFFLLRLAKSDRYKKIFTFALVYFTVLNFSMVSSIEQYEFKQHNSFAICILIMAIIFIYRPVVQTFIYFSGLALILSFHKIIGFSDTGPEVFYLATFILLPVVIIISKVNYDSRLQTYIDQYRLGKMNEYLDTQVKERTTELESTNQQLTERIELQKKYEVELTKAKIQAETSDRLKTAFLNNLSHEIRTPLNSIIGFSSLLSTKNSEDQKTVKYTHIINKSGKELLHIIDQLLDISHIESENVTVRKAMVRLNYIESFLINTTPEMLVNKKKSNLTFSLNNTCHDKDISIYTDDVLLKKILLNLVDNAIKFTYQGSVEVHIAQERDGKILFIVKDTGIGISDEFKQTLLVPFQQAESGMSRNFGGLGLGLAIAGRYIQALGGNLYFDSEKDGGSQFYFSLPASAL